MGDNLLNLTIGFVVAWFALVLIAVACYSLRPVYQRIRENRLD